MAMDQQHTDALKELDEAQARIAELEKAESFQIQLRQKIEAERDEHRGHLAVIAEMTGNGSDIGATHEGVNAVIEDMNRHKRMFVAACETLGDIQKTLGNSIVGIEPELVKELVEQRDALAAHVERLTGDVRELIDKSEGVAGLHLNGDLAPWGELTQGGRFEGWLMSLDEAPTHSLVRRDAIKQAEAFEAAIAICQKVKDGQNNLAWMHKEISPDGEEYVGDYGIPYSNKAFGAQHCVDDLKREAQQLRLQAEAQQ